MIKNPQKKVFHHKLLFTIVFYNYIERVSFLTKDNSQLHPFSKIALFYKKSLFLENLDIIIYLDIYNS
jgi:hypothetical protein